MINETIYSVLTVSSATSFTPYIPTLFPGNRFYPVKTVESALAARRNLLFRTYDIIIINSPLSDESGVAFALDCSKIQHSCVLFLSPPGIYSEVSAKFAGSGIYVMKKPFSLPNLENAISWLMSSSDKIRRLEEEKVKVEEKMEEIKIVNRAKWILIKDLEMTEEEAQRFITKEAMDKCITKKEEAGIIISTYRPL